MPGPRWADPFLSSLPGYDELTSRFAGCSFENGLYRLHDASSGRRAADLIGEVFPELSTRSHSFAHSWRGDQFVIDSAGAPAPDGPPVVMLEPGTCQYFVLPMSFSSFHERFGELREPVFAASFFAAWAAANPRSVPLGPTQCVGYKLPLFLGGKDSPDNLQVSELEVYWRVCGQFRKNSHQAAAPNGSATSALPPLKRRFT